MSMHDRAAQFAPFAALVGYDDAVAETARLTEARPELDEQEQQAMLEAIQAQEDKTQDKLKEKKGVLIRGGKNW